jgi:hypothetical protein
MQLSKQKVRLFILVSIAVIIKLVILHGITSFRLWEDNEMALNYLKTGQMAYMHDGALKYNFGDPVYSFLLVVVYKVFGVNYHYAGILNIIFSAFTAVLFYGVINAFFDFFNLPDKVKKWKEVMLLVSIAACLFHPLIMFYEIKNVHPFAMYCFFYVLGLSMMVRYFKKDTMMNLTVCSLVLGVVIFARSTFAALLLPFFLWLVTKNTIKISIFKMVYVIGISSVFSFLWLLNSYRNVNSAYVMPNDGIVMWMGSLPQTEGSNNFPDGRTFYDALTDSDLNTISKIAPAKLDSFYMAKYVYTVKHDPGLIAKMFLIKFKNFWFFRKAMGVDYPVWIQNLIPIYKVVYVAVLVLMLFAIILLGRYALILLSAPFAISLIHAAVYVETRHRIMFEPTFIFLAIIGLAWLITKMQKAG